MKKIFLFLIFLPILSEGQILNGSVLSSFKFNVKAEPLIDFSNYPNNNSTDFKISLTNRTGKFIRDSTLLVGLNLNVVYRKTYLYKSSSLRNPLGGNYFEEGGAEKVYGHAGFFVDKYFQIKKNLFFSLNNDFLYAIDHFVEEFYIVDAAGNKISESPNHTMEDSPGIVYSFYPNITYFITPKHALNCSIGQLNLDVYGINAPDPFKEYYPHIDLGIIFPAFVFGYTYQFNSKKSWLTKPKNH